MSVVINAQKKPEEKLNMAMYAITSMYVDSVQAAPLVDSQIADMLSKLDPFSEYLPPMQASDNEQMLGGHTPSVGIGIEGNVIDGHFFVSYVEPTGDAYAKGLRGGDEITSIDGVAVSSIPSDNVFSKLMGAEKSTVKLGVSHPDGKTMQADVTRTYILSSSVKAYYMLNKQTGFISLSMFSQTTVNDFKKALASLQRQGMKNLILDIQKNGGGLFDEAVALADEFLDGDKTIVYTAGAHVPREAFKAKNKGSFESGRLVVLVSNQTKSAAEIFSGAMQDWDRAVLVGGRTFGKGLIQQTLPFEDGSALRLTVARYYTPSGRTIQKPYNGQNFTDNSKTYYSLRTHRTLENIGGVSPDVAVAPDTVSFTPWYNTITYSGIQKVVARNYVIRNRKALQKQYPSIAAFNKGFDGSQLLPEVCKMSKEVDISYSESDYATSKNYLQTQLKALVARDLFNDNNAYFCIINSINPLVSKAEQILGKNGGYNTILNEKK